MIRTTLAAVAMAALLPTSPSWVSQYDTQIGADPATVYHPQGARNLPVAVLLQGANVGKASYSRFARIVAGFGFVVVVPDHRRAVGPISGLYAEEAQVNAAAQWSAEQGTKTDPGKLVVVGHSFGAAAGLFAVGNTCTPPFCFGPVYQRPSSLRAAVFHGASTAGPGGGAVPIDNAGIPVAIVQGGLDGVNPPAAGRAAFDGLSSGPAAFVTVTGANHYGLTDTQAPSGALPDTSPQTLTQEESVDASARWTGLFLRASLGDQLAAAYVYGFGDATDNDVTVTTRPGTP